MSDKGPKELDPRWTEQVTDEMKAADRSQGRRRQGHLSGAAQVRRGPGRAVQGRRRCRRHGRHQRPQLRSRLLLGQPQPVRGHGMTAPPTYGPVVSMVGKCDSGKTTFLEKLIRELTARGVRVATVKHHVHDYDIDLPGKDSWRHARAGAVVTMVSLSRAVRAHPARSSASCTLDEHRAHRARGRRATSAHHRGLQARGRQPHRGLAPRRAPTSSSARPASCSRSSPTTTTCESRQRRPRVRSRRCHGRGDLIVERSWPSARCWRAALRSGRRGVRWRTDSLTAAASTTCASRSPTAATCAASTACPRRACVEGPGRDPLLRGDRALRPHRGGRGHRRRSASPAASRSCAAASSTSSGSLREITGLEAIALTTNGDAAAALRRGAARRRASSA